MNDSKITELKRLQRLYKISADYHKIEELLSNEINSASDLFELSEKEFIDRFSEMLGGQNSAKALYLLGNSFMQAKHESKNS
jgi:hypothetical protein